MVRPEEGVEVYVKGILLLFILLASLPSDVVSTARDLVSQRQLLVSRCVAFSAFLGLCLLRKMALRRT